ncbi:addiction module protein [Anatilimnocola floriformis]|uniref:addiction module protein n=1 Tax=Anatilimnocola floriformis TaxID=2948575 RepID=UPI0020C52569|nr:addiction module protein [Anatilimnocola floriformis]
MSLTLEQFGIDRLSNEQRLELISLLWDSLPDDATFSPPDWHLRLLDERIAEADANPDNVITLDELEAKLFKKLP